MNTKSLAFVACRLFALYVLSQVLVWFVYLYNGAHLPPELIADHYSLFSVVPPVSIILGVFFWWKAEWLAENIAGKYATQEAGLRPEDVQTAGFAVIGMLLLALVADVGRSFFDPAHGYGSHALPHYAHLGGMWIIAVWLIFGASWLSRLIGKVRKL